jgi:hypothetical protein
VPTTRPTMIATQSVSERTLLGALFMGLTQAEGGPAGVTPFP